MEGEHKHRTTFLFRLWDVIMRQGVGNKIEYRAYDKSCAYGYVMLAAEVGNLKNHFHEDWALRIH